jgi:cell division protein FtsB
LDQKTDSAPKPKQSRWGFRGKTFWNWLELLVVPLALLGIGLWFTTRQETRQQQIENQRAEAERELAKQSAQDETLQTYLDQMSQLALDESLLTSEDDSAIRTLARARTLVVLDALDSSDRKRRVLRFLYEMDLIQAKSSGKPIIKLSYANLHNFKARSIRLLKGANLTQATLSGAELYKADLVGTNLSGANLSNTDLSDANLRDAKLCSASLDDDTDLSDAVLISADFSDCEGLWERGARISGADLNGADLSKADLTNTDITKKQREQVKSFEGATMPNGQKYEDWLKSREGEGG